MTDVRIAIEAINDVNQNKRITRCGWKCLWYVHYTIRTTRSDERRKVKTARPLLPLRDKMQEL